MCGLFAQCSCTDEYFEAAGIAPEELPFDAESLGRHNVAPGTRVMLLSQHEGQLHFEPVFWGYKPDWWHKAMLIKARY
ncbi:SOS response-associated peptidase family protein [Pantoea ananatis]|uniref:SOS response-associated peptidase family protein n=1 Tax=Pantoea ananas TaxID=553 RepID=UPI003709888C